MARFVSTLCAVAAVAATAVAVNSSASAQQGVRDGTLNCQVAPGIGYIIGSQKQLTCVYENGRYREPYVGTVSRFGVDLGGTDVGTISWAVFAPSSRPRGALAGHYGGVGVQATVGVGAGVNVLVGGNDRTVTLQPVSVQGQTGLNVAAGIATLDLQAEVVPRRVRHHRRIHHRHRRHHHRR